MVTNGQNIVLGFWCQKWQYFVQNSFEKKVSVKEGLTAFFILLFFFFLPSPHFARHTSFTVVENMSKVLD